MNFFKVVAVLLVTAAGIFFFLQRPMLFQAPHDSLPETLPDYVEFITLKEGYGLLLSPTVTSAAPAPLVMYMHGNAGAAYWNIENVDELRDAGFYVLLLEYPGYVGAPGRPSLKSIRRCVLEAYDTLTARESIDATKVIAYGRSIGGGAASLLAARRDVAVLALESTFTSLGALFAEKRLPSFLLRDHFDNISVVENIQVPVFLYHGTKDTLIPVHHSVQLSQVAKRYEFFQAACGHNDCPPGWQLLLEFLSLQDAL